MTRGNTDLIPRRPVRSGSKTDPVLLNAMLIVSLNEDLKFGKTAAFFAQAVQD